MAQVTDADGTQNLEEALKTCMEMCSAFTIRDLHRAEMVSAPAIQTEGKVFQTAGGCRPRCSGWLPDQQITCRLKSSRSRVEEVPLLFAAVATAPVLVDPCEYFA